MPSNGSLAHRLIAFADGPDDDNEARLRKRIGIIAGYINVVGSLALPIMAQGIALSWAVAITLVTVNAVNLVILARTRRFDRYVVVLILVVILLPAVIEVALGGLAGASATLLFAFLGPVYAILALGPQPATRWFLVFVAMVAFVLLLDPFVSSTITPQPYNQRLIFYAANLLVPLTVTFAMLRYTDLRRREAQARADMLLTNAIPSSIAARLKQGEDRIAEVYPEATVLFADLVGFTPWARATDPAIVVSVLDQLFTRFDELATEVGVEKIKTIGDSYMAVAGAPLARADHAQAAVLLARGMLDALAEVRVQADLPLDVRIGLASGPVVGGVIGSQRILFDLWGDTVNTASRMETSGVAGRINVASSTRERLGDAYAFETRDAVEVKGLGTMSTYLLSG